MADDWITTIAAAELSGYHPEHIRRLIREGSVAARKFGTVWQVSLNSLELYLRRRHKISIYPNDWKQLPIAPISKKEQQVFVRLVDAILAEFKKHDHPLPPEAAERVAELEREIDERVAALYAN